MKNLKIIVSLIGLLGIFSFANVGAMQNDQQQNINNPTCQEEEDEWGPLGIKIKNNMVAFNLTRYPIEPARNSEYIQLLESYNNELKYKEFCYLEQVKNVISEVMINDGFFSPKFNILYDDSSLYCKYNTISDKKEKLSYGSNTIAILFDNNNIANLSDNALLKIKAILAIVMPKYFNNNYEEIKEKHDANKCLIFSFKNIEQLTNKDYELMKKLESHIMPVAKEKLVYFNGSEEDFEKFFCMAFDEIATNYKKSSFIDTKKLSFSDRINNKDIILKYLNSNNIKHVFYSQMPKHGYSVHLQYKNHAGKLSNCSKEKYYILNRLIKTLFLIYINNWRSMPYNFTQCYEHNKEDLLNKNNNLLPIEVSEDGKLLTFNFDCPEKTKEEQEFLDLLTKYFREKHRYDDFSSLSKIKDEINNYFVRAKDGKTSNLIPHIEKIYGVFDENYNTNCKNSKKIMNRINLLFNDKNNRLFDLVENLDYNELLSLKAFLKFAIEKIYNLKFKTKYALNINNKKIELDFSKEWNNIVNNFKKEGLELNSINNWDDMSKYLVKQGLEFDLTHEDFYKFYTEIFKNLKIPGRTTDDMFDLAKLFYFNHCFKNNEMGHEAKNIMEEKKLFDVTRIEFHKLNPAIKRYLRKQKYCEFPITDFAFNLNGKNYDVKSKVELIIKPIVENNKTKFDGSQKDFFKFYEAVYKEFENGLFLSDCPNEEYEFLDPKNIEFFVTNVPEIYLIYKDRYIRNIGANEILSFLIDPNLYSIRAMKQAILFYIDQMKKKIIEQNKIKNDKKQEEIVDLTQQEYVMKLDCDENSQEKINMDELRTKIIDIIENKEIKLNCEPQDVDKFYRIVHKIIVSNHSNPNNIIIDMFEKNLYDPENVKSVRISKDGLTAIFKFNYDKLSKRQREYLNNFENCSNASGYREMLVRQIIKLYLKLINQKNEEKILEDETKLKDFNETENLKGNKNNIFNTMKFLNENKKEDNTNKNKENMYEKLENNMSIFQPFKFANSKNEKNEENTKNEKNEENKNSEDQNKKVQNEENKKNNKRRKNKFVI